MYPRHFWKGSNFHFASFVDEQHPCVLGFEELAAADAFICREKPQQECVCTQACPEPRHVYFPLVVESEDSSVVFRQQLQLGLMDVHPLVNLIAIDSKPYMEVS